MSKSILVIDTPECCNYCPIGRIFGMDGQVECMASKDIRASQDGKTIPDWCPLKEVPKKKEVPKSGFMIGEMFGEEMGWNACIDQILKGGAD